MSVISKIIERVVKSHLIDHLTSSKLLNPHQSAYCKHHSTEIALLYIHDHLINVIGSQKVSCLCLLDLSAAFVTIDHNILITRLSSWFGIHGSVLSWFKSYWSFRSFRVKCDKNLSRLSSFHASSCGVPQGSVLRLLLFVMYTTPLSTLIFFTFPWPPPFCRWHSALKRVATLLNLYALYKKLMYVCIYALLLFLRDSDHTPFRDNLSSEGWDLLWSTCTPNLKSLA